MMAQQGRNGHKYWWSTTMRQEPIDWTDPETQRRILAETKRDAEEGER